MKKILLTIWFILFLSNNVYSEIRSFNCNFKSENYDFSFLNGEYQFNIENAELLVVKGEKLAKGPFAKEGVEVDISNGQIALDASPNEIITGHLFINLTDGTSEVFLYKIDEKINIALINHLRKTVSVNIKNNELPFFGVIHSANNFIQKNYPETLISKGNGQC